MKWAYFCLIAGAVIIWSVVNIMHWNSTGSNISKVDPHVDQTRQTSTLTQETQAISLSFDVEQVISETAGHSVTRVIYTSDTSKMVPVFAGILIVVATVYLVVLVVYMCRKGHVFSRRSQSRDMTDNFESLESYSALTTSSWYYDSEQTSARTSEDLLNTSQQSQAIKDTMSNSSIGDLPLCPKVFRNNRGAGAGPVRPTSAKKQ